MMDRYESHTSGLAVAPYPLRHTASVLFRISLTAKSNDRKNLAPPWFESPPFFLIAAFFRKKYDGKRCADSPVVLALFDWTVKTFKRPYSMSFSRHVRVCRFCHGLLSCHSVRLLVARGTSNPDVIVYAPTSSKPSRMHEVQMVYVHTHRFETYVGLGLAFIERCPCVYCLHIKPIFLPNDINKYTQCKA